ncbi:MAG: mannose-1-phosphate guanylyltransferase [Halobellus sp.]|uniref:mannose-1-phosphate guanylyltransferase n=1 Tax=Halobellus sp. TaxID=1979212 RepID=UPI0035D49A2F
MTGGSTPAGPVVAVVLAGGTGSRLYPASRSDRPKQFLSLFESNSLLEQTVSRARDVADEVVVVTRESYADGVRERVPDVDVLVEPVSRDTGPALLYATARVDAAFTDPVILALPSDHLVGTGFAAAIQRGTEVAAATGRLVTFGVEPTRPETGYGYIEPTRRPSAATESDSDAEPDTAWAPVQSFHEKPDPETAESYVAAGHYWNAGLFAWRPSVFLEAAADSPIAGVATALRSIELPATLDAGFTAADVAGVFESVDPVSVDYAIFEVAEEVAVVPVSFPWDDVGAWDALERVVDPDDDGNVTAGTVELHTLDAGDNVVAADEAHVSLIGVSDLAVVTWDDRVLVVPKDRAQDVKQLVRRLEERGEF